MRKYRAWDKEKGFWLNPEHFYITGEGRGFTCEDSKGMYSNTYRYMGLDRYIIEQSTGKKDSKRTKEYPEGQEIYKGDYFKTSGKHGYSSNCIAEVLFVDGAFVIQLYRKDLMGIGAELLPHWKALFPDSFKVIGNRFDNPELMEQK